MADKKRVFILGSGFSAQLTQGQFPTSQQLIKQLKKDVPHPVLIRNIQDTFNQPDQIQEILSRLDLDRYILAEEKWMLKREIFMSFQRQLSLFKLYEDCDALDRAKKIVANLFKPGDVVINFNWDIVLEHLICLNYQDKTTECLFNWGQVFNPFFVDKIVDDEYGNRIRNGIWSSGTILNSESHEDPIIICKPHGSFNFLPAERDRNYPEKVLGLVPVTDRNTTFFDTDNNRSNGYFLDLELAKKKADFLLFPGINEENFSGIRDELIPVCVLPTYMKSVDSPEFLRIWRLSDDAIRKATEIIVIGYSFPPEDSITWQMLNTGLDENKIVRVLGDIDGDLMDELTLRNRIRRLGYVGRDDEAAQKSILAFKIDHKKWVEFYLPDRGNWQPAYDKLMKDLNA